MNELIAALTRAATAVAVYYEKQAGMTGKDVAASAPEAPTATRKPRAAKAEKAAEPAPEQPSGKPAATEPTPAAPVAMTEEESTARLKVVGEAFVLRFSKQSDAVEEVKRIIESKFKVSRLRDLVHAQRVELIAELEKRMKEIDAAPKAPSAPVGLGL